MHGLRAYSWCAVYFVSICLSDTCGKHLISGLQWRSMWGPVLYTNLLATPNEFATICDTQPSVCAAWEVAGYEANDPDAGDDASPGVTVAAVDPYSTKACRSCINSMQPSCAVEYCQMGLPDDDGEEEETVCGDSAAPRAASSGLLLRSLFLVAVVFAGGVVF